MREAKELKLKCSKMYYYILHINYGDFRGILFNPRPRRFYKTLSPPRPVPVGDIKFCPRPVPELRRKSGTNLEIPRGQFAIPAPSPSPNYGAGTGIPAGRGLKSPPYCRQKVFLT